MCGIFGIIVKERVLYRPKVIGALIERLGILSEARGKESAGFASLNLEYQNIEVLKGAICAHKMVKREPFKTFVAKKVSALNGGSTQQLKYPVAIIGHSRLVTNGSQLDGDNNQPIVKDGIVGVHNGIIVNTNALWERYKDLHRKLDIDTEIMLAMVRQHLNRTKSIRKAISNTFHEIFGTVTTAMLFSNYEKCLVATNHGSLYILTNKKDVFAFASERYILETAIAKDKCLRKELAEFEVKQVMPNAGYIVDVGDFNIEHFQISASDNGGAVSEHSRRTEFEINVVCLADDGQLRDSLVDISAIKSSSNTLYEESLLENNTEEIKLLKRCTKCLLPETFPFIQYDDNGICNICNNYVQRNQPKPLKELWDLVDKYRKPKGEADCIVPFSGGRDSTYTLHFVKEELGLHPIAFTYDWGMVTDLARRNIARVCGRLGVENIIVSADIRKKRANIRKNILAWLKRPELGMVPLFMAGDKYFFYYTNKVKRQNDIKLNIWGVNNLENTEFKVGFSGLEPNFHKKRIYSLTKGRQLKLFAFVFKNLMLEPSYINGSVIDTLGSFIVRYSYPKEHYYHLFDFVEWDERKIESLILDKYHWETATDTKTTWRIGDGTAGFYNYVYYTVAGFSEYDTFRSNQIREGMLSREKGLELIQEENMPRYDSIKWYLEIVGLDFERTIKGINKIPKRYRKKI